MTDKEKLKKVVGLADAMYYAAAELTTDASLLRKAMDDYHQFIIHEYFKENPVSESLEEAADNALNDVLNTHEIVNVRSCLDMFRFGAKWQKEQIVKQSVSGKVNKGVCPNDAWSVIRENHLITDNDIEYVRTDAFMKKAENFLEMLGYGFTITDNITHKNYDKEQLVEDFEEYMEGE